MKPTATDTMIDERIERECIQFLYREAELLDNRKFHAWLQLLSPEIDYRVPVRTARENEDGNGFSTKAFFMEEDFGSLTARVTRLDSKFAWSENPATRTRRLVTNFRVSISPLAGQMEGKREESCDVLSNLAVYCFRGEAAVPLILTGERQDVLQRHGGGWKLLSRLVLLDTTVLGMESLSIFL
ncbi:MAG: hypothetical protein QOF19_3416 [Alphaproteobacteria bacterium]|jgi:3-phenylpropionate/cinnamic acid dioxygenase small subunit|nr:hypothetical protein [Alphaproteobacteria bacterium]